MLTREENELLTRTGPGTPMGEVLRRYWLPALLTDEIPEPDSPPVRVRLLSEDLVAFRDTNEKVGLIGEYCAHRSASLFFGRNEECGLRCIYHGWKYDIEGRIVDTPVEPADSMIKHVVRQTAYPCREVNGVVFTYMGPAERMPPLPALPCIALSADQVAIGSKMFNECNWLQGLEGDCDSTHSAYLHRRTSEGRITTTAARFNPPTTEIDVTTWGVRGATIYPADSATDLVRTNVFVMPCVGHVPSGAAIQGSVPLVHTIWQVPRDDETCWRFDFIVNRAGKLEESQSRGYTHARHEVGPDFKKIANRGNDYLIDREKQRSQAVFSGIDFGAHVQDAAVTESVGNPIVDRTREHLGVGDAQIAGLRQMLIQATKDVAEGLDPPLAGAQADPHALDDFYLVNVVLPKGASWKLDTATAPSPR